MLKFAGILLVPLLLSIPAHADADNSGECAKKGEGSVACDKFVDCMKKAGNSNEAIDLCFRNDAANAEGTPGSSSDDTSNKSTVTPSVGKQQQFLDTAQAALVSSLKDNNSSESTVGMLFGIYSIVKICADNNIVYSQSRSDAMRAYIENALDLAGVDHESRDAAWNAVQGVKVTEHDCETLESSAGLMFPGLFISTNPKNPF